MTVGKNIQKYRKKLGISQEELGQKLFVSRQTVSFWENDQTTPTIDNLMRLKELFGVSVDEILGLENKTQIMDDEPNEAYRFNFLKAELNEINRLKKRIMYTKPLIFASVLILCIIFHWISSEPDIMFIGFVLGAFFVGTASYIKGFNSYKKNWEHSTQLICNSTYEYKIYEDYITVNIYRNNEKIRWFKCCFADIEQIQQLDKWLFLQFGGQSFIVRKNDLKENSAFYTFMYKNPSKTVKKVIPDRWRVASVIMFAASILSILVGLVLVAALSSVNNLFTENMWLFFLVTPIPIASVIFGFALKGKGYKYKKNIIAGIIMTALLCIYGSFVFIF